MKYALRPLADVQDNGFISDKDALRALYFLLRSNGLSLDPETFHAFAESDPKAAALFEDA